MYHKEIHSFTKSKVYCEKLYALLYISLSLFAIGGKEKAQRQLKSIESSSAIQE